jgi:hypothetical protein
MTTIRTLLGLFAAALQLQAAPSIYFGEDLNTSNAINQVPDNPTRLTTFPNASREAGRFLSRLTGVATESFESFAPNSTPTTLTFGADTAAISGSRTVLDLPTGTFNGVYPLTGNRTLLLAATSSGFFRLDFSSPQGAFGFWTTDVEASQLRITLITQSGTRTNIDPPFTLPQGSGGVAFFGAIDTQSPFVAVEFSRIGGATGDGFGFDDMTIGRVQQIHPEPPTVGIATYVGLQITGTVGATYRVEYTLDLATPSWSTLSDVVLPTDPYIYFDPIPINQTPKRFYRVSILE